MQELRWRCIGFPLYFYVGAKWLLPLQPEWRGTNSKYVRGNARHGGVLGIQYPPWIWGTLGTKYPLWIWRILNCKYPPYIWGILVIGCWRCAFMFAHVKCWLGFRVPIFAQACALQRMVASVFAAWSLPPWLVAMQWSPSCCMWCTNTAATCGVSYYFWYNSTRFRARRVQRQHIFNYNFDQLINAIRNWPMHGQAHGLAMYGHDKEGTHYSREWTWWADCIEFC